MSALPRERTYLLQVKLRGSHATRTIAAAPENTLAHVHDAIQHAFNYEIGCPELSDDWYDSIEIMMIDPDGTQRFAEDTDAGDEPFEGEGDAVMIVNVQPESIILSTRRTGSAIRSSATAYLFSCYYMPHWHVCQRHACDVGVENIMSTIEPIHYTALLVELKQRIRAAQYAALRAVNEQLVGMYWDIGRLIVERQQGDSWGRSIVE